MKLLRVRVPNNYDPETRIYSGVWDGTFRIAWTDNPAWCFYDLITNTRYGLGDYIPEAQVDKWALYRAARYCDELVPDGMGGTEPRFTCNLYLQTREQAYKVVQDMASIFRGMVYWSGGAITVTQDAPVDPIYQFAPANVVDGEFAYQGSSAKARHTVALVTWNDPDDFYRQKVEYVEDAAGIARYGVVESQLIALGCTSRGQAHRVGKWLLYSEQSESEVVTLSQTILGKLVPPEDVTGFKVVRRTTDLLLSWHANPDLDLAGYEVRVGAGWDVGTLVGQTAGTQLVHDQSEAGTYDYHIRAFDTSGKYSSHVTTFSLLLTAPTAVRQFDVIQSGNRLEFRWQPNSEREVVAYEIREGSAWDTSIFIAEIKSTSYTLPSGFDGDRKFWIKSIASPGTSNAAPYTWANAGFTWSEATAGKLWSAADQVAYELVVDTDLTLAELRQGAVGKAFVPSHRLLMSPYPLIQLPRLPRYRIVPSNSTCVGDLRWF